MNIRVTTYIEGKNSMNREISKQKLRWLMLIASGILIIGILGILKRFHLDLSGTIMIIAYVAALMNLCYQLGALRVYRRYKGLFREWDEKLKKAKSENGPL